MITRKGSRRRRPRPLLLCILFLFVHVVFSSQGDNSLFLGPLMMPPGQKYLCHILVSLTGELRLLDFPFLFPFVPKIILTPLNRTPGTTVEKVPQFYEGYNPTFLDDPELRTGKHKKVISLPFVLVSRVICFRRCAFANTSLCTGLHHSVHPEERPQGGVE